MKARRILPAQWADLEPILDAALEVPASQRSSLIATLTAGDPERIAVLEQLIADCERETPFLSRPAGERFAALFDDGADAVLPEVLGGRYRIEREIGRGGMARVYLARDEKHSRSVAIKIIRPDLAASLGRDRFLREIGIAARLRHPNIVPLFDSGDAGGILHFVMPYEEGPSLRARLDDGKPMTAPERISILRDIARALAYAHTQGVVHRDVKPDNVMLSGGAAVVTDFGIAKAVSVAQGESTGNALTSLGAGIGTPAYMAPEQAVGDPSTDHRADIYSFGCVAYEMFSGRPPFHDMPSHRLIASHVGVAPVAIGDVSTEVPAAVGSLIMRCLEKSPAARPQTAGELLEALDDDGTLRPSSLSAPRLHGTKVSRRSTLMAAAAVLLIATAIGAVAMKNRGNATQGIASARSISVLPMVNETGDARLDYVTTGIAEGVGRRLQQSGGFDVRWGAPSEWPASPGAGVMTATENFGPTILLRMVLARAGDSLEVRARLLDAATKRERTLPARSFSTLQLRDLESRLAAGISGAVFRVARPIEPRAPDRAVDPLSYRVTLEGWHQFLVARNHDRARILFDSAIALDGTNARAWSGRSSVWGRMTITNGIAFERGYELATTAASQALELDSLQGTALINLAIMEGWKHRSLAVAEDLLRRAKAAEPSNSEIYQVEGALLRHAWQWERSLDAMRIAQQLDPHRFTLFGHESDILECQDKVGEAEKLLQQEAAASSIGTGRRRLPSVLARLKRYDEALASMRQDALRAGNDSLAAVIASAKGENGYWSIVQGSGRVRLARLRERRGWTSPYLIMLAQFEAGDTENAYASLAALDRAGDVNLVKLRCTHEINHERGNPRLESVLARVPGFAVR